MRRKLSLPTHSHRHSLTLKNVGAYTMWLNVVNTSPETVATLAPGRPAWSAWWSATSFAAQGGTESTWSWSTTMKMFLAEGGIAS